jgi:hypothetical protein
MKDDNLILGRDIIKENKVDTYRDKVFIRQLVKRVRNIDPDIGAIFYPESNLIVFFWRRVIIHKVLLNEDQIDNLGLEYHINHIQKVVQMLKLGLLPIKEIKKARNNIKRLKLNYGKNIS